MTIEQYMILGFVLLVLSNIFFLFYILRELDDMNENIHLRFDAAQKRFNGIDRVLKRKKQ